MENLRSEHVEAFIDAIAPWGHAYSVCGLSYLAVANDTGWTLLHGRLFLSVHPLKVNAAHFRSRRIVAGHIPLTTSDKGHAELIRSLSRNGEIESPVGTLTLRKEPSGQFSAFNTPLHQVGLSAQNRLSVLVIGGGSRFGLVDQPATDWELRAAAEPYETLGELENAYSLGGYSGDSTVIEVVANQVVSIATDSHVSGTRAELTMLAASGLDLDKCRIGYRVVSNRIVVNRGSVAGNAITWTTDSSQMRGTIELDVPPAAVVECFASYSDCTQHYFWVSDPQHFQNPLRMALQAADTGLDILRDYLFEERQERREARHFEHGVAMLTWMLGFTVAQPGATPRLSDAADIVAATPKGDMLVIECTIGLLRAENKLPKLVDRARAIRNSLDASGNGHVRVLPVIVTAREAASVQAEVPSAESVGVSVATKETLRDLLNATVGVSDPQGLFERMWTAVQSHSVSGGAAQ
jgi:hypothetical protein